MMTSTQIRQSFLDFFRSKQHTIVASSSLMPDSPNLLFTNAGMNQFVPIFLNQTPCPYSPGRAADTQKCIRAGGKHNDLDDVGLDTYHHTFFEMLGNWSFGDYFKQEAISWAWELVIEVWKFPPQRLYATVFCPHMDMERWEEELQTAVLLAKAKIDGARLVPSEPSNNIGTDVFVWSDMEAAQHWAEHFLRVGCDPFTHIVPGNKKDNFWMMGETGPCGPCSELHVDLTPLGDTKGALVNKGDARCIEIWNNVFIQFNANPNGTFSPLPAKHVDTGMGFERVTSIIQGTKNLTDFAHAKISNYETDIFRPIFDELEKMSGKKYGSTLPKSGSTGDTEQEKVDIAFRVIGDHIRTLSFAIADGIQPGNDERNYVLRKILRRAICPFGNNYLGLKEPFLHKLVQVVVDHFGDIFPEIRAKRRDVEQIIEREERSFRRTLKEGLFCLNAYLDVLGRCQQVAFETEAQIPELQAHIANLPDNPSPGSPGFERVTDYCIEVAMTLGGAFPEIPKEVRAALPQPVLASLMAAHHELRKAINPIFELLGPVTAHETQTHAVTEEAMAKLMREFEPACAASQKQLLALANRAVCVSGEMAFLLHGTYGFPFDVTSLVARERAISVAKAEFDRLMREEQERARAAQKKTVIELSQIETKTPTRFLGYDALETPARVLEVVGLKDKTAVVLDTSTCYAEMGGQLGDTGELTGSGQLWRVFNTQKSGNTWLHILEAGSQKSEDGSQNVDAPVVGSTVTLTVEKARRDAIQRHHTVTHLLHWALHEVVSRDASQKGSFVGPDKLTFDFNSAALTPAQVADIEKLVNERIVENAGVSWTEVPHADVKSRKDVMQFFGDKYGDTVRVVQIGGGAGELNG